MAVQTHNQMANFIWSICNLLRGPYKRNEYRKVILPLTVLRRFDCILSPTKQAVLNEFSRLKGKSENIIQARLREITGVPFYNLSRLTFERLLDDPNQLAPNLNSYINAFSPNVRRIFERFDFGVQIHRMNEKNLLFEVIKKFASPDIDLSPVRIDNMQMGYIFEELIRIGAEQSNEEAGEHFTPREVIRLMVNLLLQPLRRHGHAEQKPCGREDLRPGLRDGRHAFRLRKPYQNAQCHRTAPPVRTGLERRGMGGLPLGHADQGRGSGQYQAGLFV